MDGLVRAVDLDRELCQLVEGQVLRAGDVDDGPTQVGLEDGGLDGVGDVFDGDEVDRVLAAAEDDPAPEGCTTPDSTATTSRRPRPPTSCGPTAPRSPTRSRPPSQVVTHP